MAKLSLRSPLSINAAVATIAIHRSHRSNDLAMRNRTCRERKTKCSPMMYGAGVSTSPQTRSSVGARVAKSDAHTGTSHRSVGDGANS